ncbi:MAG: stage II sporulation protein D [Ruminococcaceae bacterium]|nr:stage II sporulation protein D [Oscillospiraceae bacterium]
MKKRKINLAKKYFYLFIPIFNLILIIALSSMFSGQNVYVKNEDKVMNRNEENEKIISVYFHTLDKVEKINIEEYLVGVLPAEMPPSFNLEALKAQAVAARTFILNREDVKDEKHKGAIVCTDFNHCKAYMTEDEADKKWGIEWDKTYKNKIKRAISETRGQIITYNNEPISAVFHSTSSGKTENSEDVWQNALPYLRSVESEGEDKSPRFKSIKEVSIEEFKQKIKSINNDTTFGNDKKSWIGNITYNESGSVKTVIIAGKEFKGTEIRTLFGLRSTNFEIVVGDKVTFNVTGNGHGVGMSQYGANYAAENGYTYDQILKKYYSGIELKDMYNI